MQFTFKQQLEAVVVELEEQITTKQVVNQQELEEDQVLSYQIKYFLLQVVKQ